MPALRKHDWVTRVGHPPWVGRVTQLAGEDTYYVYWLGHGGSWHDGSELTPREIDGDASSRRA